MWRFHSFLMILITIIFSFFIILLTLKIGWLIDGAVLGVVVSKPNESFTFISSISITMNWRGTIKMCYSNMALINNKNNTQI